MIRWVSRISASSPWRRRGLAALAGFLTALALPPLGLWPALFVGVPLFLVVLEREKQGRWRTGFGSGWFFGLGYFAFAFHWIGFAFLVEAETYLWMMPFMLGALAGGMAIYWGLAAIVAKRFGGNGLPLALMLAASLAVAEWLRGHLLTGFPWAAPGLAVDGMGAVAQLASVIGMTGLTFMIVLWGGLPYVMLRKAAHGSLTAALVLLALLPLAWSFGAWRLAQATHETVPGVALRIVQPNISQEAKWRAENARGIFSQLLELSAAPTAEQPEGIGGVTHLIWPESAVPFLIDESEVAKAELKPLLGGRTALITGSLRREWVGEGEPDVFNSMIVFGGDAEVTARYDKWRLVPGGEFLPFASVLEPLGFRKVVRTPGSFRAGPGPQTIAIPGLPPAALLVCYEVIFPHGLVDSANRPAVLVNVTNDGWFGRSTGPYQHLAQARLRSIEQGLPLVRAANTGISTIIDAHGRIIHALPLLETGVLDSALPVALSVTVYAAWGDWILAALIAMAGIMVILLQRFWTVS